MHAVDATDSVELSRGVVAPGWRLLEPLTLRVELDDDGTLVVSDEVFALHGDGPNREAAIHDYVQTLVEYFELLAERSVGDGPTSALLGLLKRYLEKEGGSTPPT